MTRTPNIDSFLLIIGAMKCGTTTLFEHLAGHPQIAESRHKEPRFFAGSLNWWRGTDWYEKLWDYEPSRHKYAMEASTHYTKIPEFSNAARRIAKLDRDFRFIYLVRNPVERIESHLTHGLARGWLSERRHISQHWDALALSKYGRQIREYEKRFDSDQILVLDFHRFVANTDAVMQKVFDFLDLPPAPYEPDARHNSVGHVLTRSLAGRILRPIRGFLPARKLAQALEIPLEKAQLSEEEREYVWQFLDPDLEHLRTEYDIDLATHRA